MSAADQQAVASTLDWVDARKLHEIGPPVLAALYERFRLAPTGDDAAPITVTLRETVTLILYARALEQALGAAQ